MQASKINEKEDREFHINKIQVTSIPSFKFIKKA